MQTDFLTFEYELSKMINDYNPLSSVHSSFRLQSQLTNKQRKARNKAKRAKQARKKNR